MSRVTSGDVRYVKATSNVYTALVGIALMVQLVGLVVIFVRYKHVFGSILFST